jgi:hypothetical protein
MLCLLAWYAARRTDIYQRGSVFTVTSVLDQSSNTIAALMAVLFRMLSSASPNCSSLNTLLTMPLVLILPESRYSTVCAVPVC